MTFSLLDYCQSVDLHFPIFHTVPLIEAKFFPEHKHNYIEDKISDDISYIVD